jgi:hypothetical protein
MTVPTLAPTDEAKVFCNICRQGGNVTNLVGTIASVTLEPSGLLLPFTCQQADVAGRTRMFTLSDCFLAQSLAAAGDVCGCVGGPFGPIVTPAPTPPPVPVVVPTPAPTPFPSCSICLVPPVGNPFGTIGIQSCQALEEWAQDGQFSSLECAIFQGLSRDPCQCGGPPTAGTYT